MEAPGPPVWGWGAGESLSCRDPGRRGSRLKAPWHRSPSSPRAQEEGRERAAPPSESPDGRRPAPRAAGAGKAAALPSRLPESLFGGGGRAAGGAGARAPPCAPRGPRARPRAPPPGPSPNPGPARPRGRRGRAGRGRESARRLPGPPGASGGRCARASSSRPAGGPAGVRGRPGRAPLSPRPRDPNFPPPGGGAGSFRASRALGRFRWRRLGFWQQRASAAGSGEQRRRRGAGPPLRGPRTGNSTRGGGGRAGVFLRSRQPPTPDRAVPGSAARGRASAPTQSPAAVLGGRWAHDAP